MGITEDELANSIIDEHRQLGEIMEYDFDAYPEAHYNHYGNRGVADLYIVEENDGRPNANGFVYELKSEYAVRQATGANEIIRQFNRMREFFFDGSSHERPTDLVRFTLGFAGTEYNLRHIYENLDMYAATVKNSYESDDTVESESVIQLNDPDTLSPVVVLGRANGETVEPLAAGDEFGPHVERRNEEIFERCETVIREIAAEQ
ncbi:hypothetical protein [Salinilacihabitans rarus]|uniref:hypothetical protein n=1 Tax=Salinilacihabitans rarus TaxID=2961596 RepID=UPI0020C90190|nr:hypothetical protein [Salinilacihabitans rarus]